MNRFTPLLAALLASPAALAQQQRVQHQAVEIRIPEVTEVDFAGAHVRATASGPGLGLISEPPRSTHPPMIRLRTDFNAEMAESTFELR